MAKPKYFYEIEEHQTVAHTDDARAITVQQANLINDKAPDSHIYLNRETAAILRDALDTWLKETAEQAA